MKENEGGAKSDDGDNALVGVGAGVPGERTGR